MRVEQVLVEVFACTGPHYRDHDHGLSLTAFSRHLSDQPFPPLAVRDASPKHGLPEPCLSMPATGSQKAPRVSPFRSGCGRHDAANGGNGDGRGRIFSEVTEKDGGVVQSCPLLLQRTESRPLIRPFGPPSPRRGEEICRAPAFGKEREACSSPRRGEVPERSEAMRGQRCRHPLHHVKRND